MVSESSNVPEWKFLQGDCVSIPFGDDHFDLVFGSPPYESQREYAELKFSLSGEEWVEWAVPRFVECLRVSKGLVAWVVEGVTSDFDYSYTPFLLASRIKQLGYKLRKPSVYNRHGIPGTGGPDWLRNDWEPIICATKRGRLPWSEPAELGPRPRYKSPRTATNRSKDGTRKKAVYIDPERSNPGNVIRGHVGMGHLGWSDAHLNEAPFPQWLAEFHVRAFCPPSGWVLDPFSGSGTTVAAAVKYGRSGVGMDIRESQVKLGTVRLNGLTVAEMECGQRLLC